MEYTNIHQLYELSEVDQKEKVIQPICEALFSDEMHDQQMARINSFKYKEDLLEKRWADRGTYRSLGKPMSEICFEIQLRSCEQFDPVYLAAQVFQEHPFEVMEKYGLNPNTIMTELVDLIMTERYTDKITGISRYFEEWATVLVDHDETMCELYSLGERLYNMRLSLRKKMLKIMAPLGLGNYEMNQAIAELVERDKLEYDDKDLEDFIFNSLVDGTYDGSVSDLYYSLLHKCQDKIVDKFHPSDPLGVEEEFRELFENEEYYDGVLGECYTFATWSDMLYCPYTKELYRATKKLDDEVCAVNRALKEVQKMFHPEAGDNEKLSLQL